MERFKGVFKNPKTIIGMVHLQAMPGTPKNTLSNKQIIEHALHEARLLKNAGFHSILIENMHDTPYLNKKIGHEISSLMSIVGYQIKKETKLPVGIQILAGANKQALAVAHAANLDYIRAEGFVFGHIADEGYMDSCAGELLRYRKYIGAENIAIFTDIKKKHSSHVITDDISIGETAKAANFFMSDGIIVTGSSTGEETALQDLTDVRKSTQLPILIGSGITIHNIEKYLPHADAFIVGSSIKEQGYWYNKINTDYCELFIKSVNSLTKNI